MEVKSMRDKRIALVTGANKGIGFEVAKQLGNQGIKILIGARDRERGEEAVTDLQKLGISASLLLIDVTNQKTIQAAAKQATKQYGKLDILVNNAGITGSSMVAPSLVDIDVMRAVYETNVFGVVAVTNAFLPLLRKSSSARIVNVSSGLGSLTLTSDKKSEFVHYNILPYQSSKTALNAVTVAYAKELADSDIKVNAADPGYTATDLNQNRGYKTTEQAAQVIIKLATIDDNGPTGTYQDENGEIDW
jgi:NAD(P)-dependent dehydrogenase (short-subunit alcohol dehydrogenase family)